ncbi:flagellar biosynthetic protein FliR [Alkalibacter mobilis]|uniref:flagellar biosynthetic protein FliR n=1 Tax=Alkalibacter mobilis TaxID=2787712 RepID=UPI001CED872A|nr:flagellar biosynthetic protein FliR [Alkalibacter mobilis]MBF7096308.1 flagellar biosynthetic protein FliR [Alkalibacter mobilis]
MFVLEVQAFLYIMVRITSFIVVVPGFSHKSLPNTSKVALSLVLSWLVYMNLSLSVVQENTVYFMLGAIRETIIGLSMGFMAKLIFSAVEMAGQYIDFQVGYSMGAVFDPSSGNTSSYYGSLFYWISILVFFILNLHHTMIISMIESFQLVSPGTVGFGSINLEGVLYMFSHAFKIGFSLAAPMLIVLLVTDIVMGLISRTVPQINVFMLGMPLKSLVGLIVFLLLITSLLNYAGKNLMLMDDFIQKSLEMFR